MNGTFIKGKYIPGKLHSVVKRQDENLKNQEEVESKRGHYRRSDLLWTTGNAQKAQRKCIVHLQKERDRLMLQKDKLLTLNQAWWSWGGKRVPSFILSVAQSKILDEGPWKGIFFYPFLYFSSSVSVQKKEGVPRNPGWGGGGWKKGSERRGGKGG